ncbi:bicarbonate transport system permease protein CmpB [Abditibacteriota bacterium]|nr:bicarbonate transport system permease protein CmpB [Abditibacteriota bacterium]
MVQDASALSHGAPATVAVATASKSKSPSQVAQTLKGMAAGFGWFLISMAILLALWAILCATFAKDLPTPLVTAKALGASLAHPFFKNDDGTMGVGNLVIASLGRVFMGFGMATLVAIPLGIVAGLNPWAKKIIDPIAAVMRPVSPLAWFPLSQVIFRSFGSGATPAAIVGTIAICCLWPTLMNTAFGVASLPADYRTVAKVFQFSPTRFLTKVLLPYSIPHMLTGLRLSLGIAWLVIVAAEMLSGSSGIGFGAYDAYNNGRLDEMVATIIVIGAIGLILDRGFDWLANRLDYEKK